ncbi:1,2-phenylacetyl-CoA epoxidase subunit PaaC [Kineococcus sp. SYSU DK001]|uniref:1,2-phenylacetyl-CoA epoxidase subunit PaaC n=1 Tax=Kineococcus sp. SYSU DK001 TaxID=3383122 RepID=UPI003D7CBE55
MTTTTTAAEDVREATVRYLLRLADDALVLGQRLGAQLTRAPQLEEDVALSNIALDLLGQARPLLSRAAELEGAGRDEDALAFGRDERDFLNCQLVEQPDGDFAETIVRQLFFSLFQFRLYEGLTGSSDEVIAGVAAKGVKEIAYHRDHAVQWTLRLGDGTPESHRRAQAALQRLWPFTGELFEVDDTVRTLVSAGVAVDPAALRAGWDAELDAVLAEATLERPTSARVATGGRRGVHTETFGFLLAEMQHLWRSHPGATW